MEDVEVSMSNEELERTLKALERLRFELDTPEKCRAFLVEAGFNTPDGSLTEPYRQNA
jgi:hypothetical protein